MWNVKLSRVESSARVQASGEKKKYPVIRINLPAPLVKAFQERGYTHVTVSVAKDGILMRPYTDVTSSSDEVVELPDWSDK